MMTDASELQRREVSRRFNLGDLMIVVVAVGSILGGAKAIWDHPVQPKFPIPPSAAQPPPRFNPFINYPRMGYEVAEVGALVASLTLVALRSRRPRPRWSRLMRQPGWIACLAASGAGVAATGLDWVGRSYGDSIGYRSRWGWGFDPSDVETPPVVRLQAFTTVGLVVGLVVLTSWLILALGGRWRAERSWVDRAGRVVGVIWLLLLAGYPALSLIP